MKVIHEGCKDSKLFPSVHQSQASEDSLQLVTDACG